MSVCSRGSGTLARMTCQVSVPRDVFPPTPPGPEGSNGNGLLRVQWVPGAWLFFRSRRLGRFISRSNCAGRVFSATFAVNSFSPLVADLDRNFSFQALL